jgi:hypothetical protein
MESVRAGAVKLGRYGKREGSPAGAARRARGDAGERAAEKKKRPGGQRKSLIRLNSDKKMGIIPLTSVGR